MPYVEALYDKPEDYGCVVIGEINGGGGYDFDLVVVYQHTESGKVYFASAAGCSCSCPSMQIETLEDCTELTNETWDDFVKALDNCYSGTDADKTELMFKAAKGI